jgi:hypothetical protein
MDESPQPDEGLENPQSAQPMENEGLGVPPLDAALEKKKHWRDFWIGLVGSTVGNIVLAVMIFIIQIGTNLLEVALTDVIDEQVRSILTGIVLMLLYALPFMINIGALILMLVRHRKWIAIGILVSYALAFLLSLIIGVIYLAACFWGFVNQ